MMFKLACVQMAVEAGNVTRNLSHAQELIGQAAQHGAQFVVLPEMMDVGWTHPLVLATAGTIPDGDTCRRLRAAARQHNVYVCAGFGERVPDGTIYNAAVIINPMGEVILHHRKLNELDIAHHLYALGDRLGVCQTEFGTFGLLICADAFADGLVISRTLGYMGADIIVSPSSWAVPPDHDNATDPYGESWRGFYCPVARDFSLWFIGVSNVGTIPAGAWAGWNAIGCSLVIDANGQQVTQGPYGVDAETILYVDVELTPRPARGTGWADRHIG